MIRLWPEAVVDLDDLAAYLARNSPAAARRFQQAAHDTFRDLEAVPGMGSSFPLSHPHLQGIRHRSVRGFPNHIIFYREIPGRVEIIRVLHGARDIQAILEGRA